MNTSKWSAGPLNPNVKSKGEASMGTRLRVTELEIRFHPDAVVRADPIAEVVIRARTEPIEVEGPDNLRIEWSGDLGLSPDLGPNPEFSGRLATTFAPGAIQSRRPVLQEAAQ
jgi:hypothetical protein